MKTKICKILNIVVLIYIFNVPIVLASVDISSHENVVITTESTSEVLVEEPVLNTPVVSDAEVLQIPTESHLDDVSESEQGLITSVEIDENQTPQTTIPMDEPETEIDEQESYTTLPDDSDVIIPVDSNLQQELTVTPESNQNLLNTSSHEQNLLSDTQIINQNLDSSTSENSTPESDQEVSSTIESIDNQNTASQEDLMTPESNVIENINQFDNHSSVEEITSENNIEVSEFNTVSDYEFDSSELLFDQNSLTVESQSNNVNEIDESPLDESFSNDTDLTQVLDIQVDQESNDIQQVEQESNLSNDESSDSGVQSPSLEVESELNNILDLNDKVNPTSSPDSSVDSLEVSSSGSSNDVLGDSDALNDPLQGFLDPSIQENDLNEPHDDLIYKIQPNPEVSDQSLNTMYDISSQSGSVNESQSGSASESTNSPLESNLDKQETLKSEPVKTQGYEDLEKSIENIAEQKMYTDTIGQIESENPILDIQDVQPRKSTTQIIEIPQKNKVYIEFKPKENKESLFSKDAKLGAFEQRDFYDLVVEETLSEFNFLEKRANLNNLSSLGDSVSEDSIYLDSSEQELGLALSSEYRNSNVNLIAFESHEINLDSSSENALSSTGQKQKSPLNNSINLGLLDEVHPSKVSEDLNLNGCADLIENNHEFKKFCNFLDDKLVTEKSNLSLNLKSTKNVFNTQKVVLNGVSIPNAKIELHLVSVNNDKILSVIQSDKNGNFIYLLDSTLVDPKAKLYLKDEFSNLSKNYEYAFDFSRQKSSPKVLKLCGQNYREDQTVLCNPKEGFDIKFKSDYQTLTKAYFNSVVHTAVVATNNTQNIAVLNPDSSIKSDLKSGDVHRVILQNFDPLNPEVLSEPIEIFYKVHYPIINPVLLPLFVLLFLLAVVILYDYLINSYQDLNSKLIYESYKVFKNSDIKPSTN